jgi:ethanolamine permease
MAHPATRIVTVATLHKGQAGWFLLGTLGISAVIAGEFGGWNWGLAHGGWGGMLLATLVAAVLFFALVYCIAELACIIPTAGGGYGFARCAFGPYAGFMTGVTVGLQYTLGVAVIATFINAYCASLTQYSGWPVLTVCFVLGCGLHCLGVGAAMRIVLALGTLALAGIVLFLAVAAPHFSASRLLDIVPTSGTRFLPSGALGVWTSLPFAFAGFVGVESIALASEEAGDVTRDIPRGLLFGQGFLFVLTLALLCIAPAARGSAALATSASPLVDALTSGVGGPASSIIVRSVNVGGLIGLLASFFSTIYAYSRQIFSLARAGYLPRPLGSINRRQSPWLAVLVPGGLALLLALTADGPQLYVLLIFFSLAAYVLIFAAHIRLRLSRADLVRPYRTPGGIFTALVGLFLTLLTFVACFLAEPLWSWAGAGALGLLSLYFLVYARHRVISNAPEEEFAVAQTGPSPSRSALKIPT